MLLLKSDIVITDTVLTGNKIEAGLFYVPRPTLTPSSFPCQYSVPGFCFLFSFYTWCRFHDAYPQGFRASPTCMSSVQLTDGDSHLETFCLSLIRCLSKLSTGLSQAATFNYLCASVSASKAAPPTPPPHWFRHLPGLLLSSN